MTEQEKEKAKIEEDLIRKKLEEVEKSKIKVNLLNKGALRLMRQSKI